ncbi:MAG: NAD-dependent DNA ligase LigA [Eubacterium sp.]|nr:NAD-dependent DNA ligase LigA [Eubacterium sp.]
MNTPEISELMRNRIQKLVQRLQEASRAYYAEDREIMSNNEYDALYDELEALERETGIILANSPTVQVGYAAVDSLPKETHARPMLSLDKTKDRDALRAFAGNQKVLLSWKLDGLTIVLTYRDGKLFKAVTRGNGVTGEVVTNNARVFVNTPLSIPHKGEVVLRGEAIITYEDFDRINETIEDVDAKYKNPRNLCSGSVRQLNNEITAQRSVRFYAFSLVSAEGIDFHNSHEQEFRWLASQGFDVVEYRVVTADSLDAAMDAFEEKIKDNPFPSDGLVALYDDIAYGESLGTTAKFPRNAIAFKWADEKRSTHLREIEWSPSRTGLLNPVAIFDPVDLEGSTVSRASVHNVSIVKELKLGIGDELEVYKANMIIPQIAVNLTASGTAEIPAFCPVCGGPTEIRTGGEAVETLYCSNPDCPAKQMKSFTLFVSRDALNMDGISESTLEKFMAHGLIHDYADLFRLEEHRETIIQMDGFGELSCSNLLESIEKARTTTVSRLLYALGIPEIGTATARLISRAFQEDLEAVRHADAEQLAALEGIGAVIARSFEAWWADTKHAASVDALLPFLTFTQEFQNQGEQKLEGLTFVITGSLNHFANRNALKKLIEDLGGKVTGSVSAKTSFLINNDVTSTSGKNKKAAELQIPILSEEDFIARFTPDAF